MDDQAVIGENEATRLRFNITQYAEVAQLVERHLAKVDVAGPSPVFRSNDNLICGSGSVGRAPPCQGGCRGSESRLPLHVHH